MAAELKVGGLLSTMRSVIDIAPAQFPEDTETVRELFNEYIGGLGVDLSFQDVERELADIPGKYSPPPGTILLARDREKLAVGCVALRALATAGDCEMKRLYVRPEARGQDLGRRLVEAVIAFARNAKHERILLDTLASMRTAQKLYAELGFRATEPYYSNPMTGTKYLALRL